MSSITVNVTLYGPLAKFAGGKYIAQEDVILKAGAKVKDLMDHFSISHDQKSYLFINAVLCDMPGLLASIEERLQNGDHVGIFSLQHMWPYQYRDGIRMSETLTETLQKHGAMHNVY
ncbi:MAG: MoaD/ThiS family protein [Chloroflexi bacterium]|nr:MoaD/ThiS family protein [Chloroflexota bacterium]